MTWLIGVDEAGRGPLAGPVAVGLVRVPEGFDLADAFPGLNDSKKLTEKRREELFALLEERVRLGDLLYTVQMREAQEIDTRGIAVVIREAVADGLALLCAEEKEYVQVRLDGALRAPSHFVQETIIGGDALEPCIMLASVAAKVVRDRHMKNVHEAYPEYDFAQHKGYGTRRHLELIQEFGPCAIHRRTFIHLDRVS